MVIEDIKRIIALNSIEDELKQMKLKRQTKEKLSEETKILKKTKTYKEAKENHK